MSDAPFSILGTTKLKFLPFVINPAIYNGYVGNAAACATPLILVFSFKNVSNSVPYKMKINIVPESFRLAFNEDIANKLLYIPNNTSNYEGLFKSITFDSLLDYMPTIEIREFIPDTKLEQFLNFFGQVIGKLMEMFKGMFSGGNDNKKAENDQSNNAAGGGFMNSILEFGKGVYDTVANVINNVFTFLVGGDETKPSLYWTLDNNGKKHSRFDIDKNPFNLYTTYIKNDDDKSELTSSFIESALVHDFPRLVYYKLQSVTNTNVYVIPNNLSDKNLYNSNGHSGWDTSDSSIAVTKEVEKIPLVGALVGKLFKSALSKMDNLRISYMPYWKSEKGNDAHPDIKIEFELFNDTYESAIANFIFVNTIVPNNKFIQYGMFLHATSLYDVKIGGYDRLFACSGKFDVKYKGILRKPSQRIIDELLKHINGSIIDKQLFKNNILNYDLIRIPDTYEVAMEFKSLLPASFNNYIYTYSTNESIIHTIEANQLESHVEGPMYNILAQGLGDLAKVLADSDEAEKNKIKDTMEVNQHLDETMADQTDITKAGEI